ncbi:MAG: HAMP domain-containing sensor histidine kinase [Pseudomonadota bacterium]
MERSTKSLTARGITDDRDRLVTADDPLADLQKRCGGTLPGILAVPELLEIVQQGRRMGLKISREFSAFDGDTLVSGFVRVHPLGLDEGEGCEVLIENWQSRAAPEPNTRLIAQRVDMIDRACAEVVGRLDADQRVQIIQTSAADTASFESAITQNPRSVWSDHVTLEGMEPNRALHWRLLDGARCRIEGSNRPWRVRLLPIGGQSAAPNGFELFLVAAYPLDPHDSAPEEPDVDLDHTKLIGAALTPVLKRPIARVIANAETIRARLAGPLRAEYSHYAGNIASAGQLLSGLLDDLSDLEVVEAENFATAREPVDLLDAARRAAGILGVRAQAKSIEIVLGPSEDIPQAVGEFRRVLQILINLIGNAISYSPENSVVTASFSCSSSDETVSVSVSDEGPGIDEEQVARVFDKYERLGRDNDGGSGLGLYISSRLAQAMSGDLVVANPGEEGATFRLTLPVYR